MMRNKRYLMIIALLLVVSFIGINAFSFADEWRKGVVTNVTEDSIKIDGRIYYIDESVIIRDLDGEILPSETRYLRGVEEVLYKEDRGVLKEIRIFRRRH